MEIWFGDNPYFYIRNNKDIENLVSTLLDNTVVCDDKQDGSILLKLSTKALLISLFSYMHDYTDPSQKTFTNIMRLLQAGQIDEDYVKRRSPLDTIFEEIHELDPESFAVKQYDIFCRMCDGTTKQTAIASCIERLKELGVSATEDEDIATENVVSVIKSIEDEIEQKGWRKTSPLQSRFYGSWTNL